MEFLSEELQEELQSFMAIFEETELSVSEENGLKLKLEIFPSDWFSSCIYILSLDNILRYLLFIIINYILD